MKNSKKLLSVSLIVLMLGLMTACGNKATTDNATDTNETTGTTTDTTDTTTNDTTTTDQIAQMAI